ncbi:MAG: DNA primase [Eubacteriales bacterium]|nr:DNA primase [Eubacteriales bacterium]
MARFSDAWLSELYAKNDIVDVVSGYTTLSERGGRYWGLCPFHNEKTPSFSVSKDKQLYYCFGCKQGGNVAHFIMKTENVLFGEAIEMLARRAHMEMPHAMEDKDYSEIKKKRQQIAEMNKMAARFYFDTLHTPKGAQALAYLKKRGIEENIIKRFGLGYAPDEWDNVLNRLRQKGFPQSLIKESGLVQVTNNNTYDAFRNRVMFPIINTFGDVIAFGGRVLDDTTPKYLNTKETMLFNKRRNLYGLDLVRKMRSIKSVVIVEGYMDVVSLQAHGVRAVVASLGTALTKEQAMLIKRYAHDVFLAYDGDEAGEIATMKAIDVLSAEGHSVKVIRFDDGMDPDDFIRKNGLGEFAKKVKNAVPAIGYKLDMKKRSFDLQTEDGREGYAIAATKIIAAIESPIIKERYMQRLAKETGYSQNSIQGQIQNKDAPKNTNDNYRYNSIKKSDKDNAEDAFLAYALANVHFVENVIDDISADDFSLKSHGNIFSVLYDGIKRGIQPTYAELLSELEYEEDRNEAARLSDMQVIADDPEAYLKDCISNMRKRKLEKKRQSLMEGLRDASSENKRKLLAEIGEIDKELNHIEGIG